jgi:hypothetical protein
MVYEPGGIYSTPAIATDLMIITSTEGTVYTLKKEVIIFRQAFFKKF